MKFIYLILLFQLSIFTTNLHASNVLVSTLGYTETNATIAFQNAINSNFDTLIFDLQLADWNLEPLSFFGITDKVLIFEKGVILQAIPGLFDNENAVLLRFYSGENIELIGYGATFKMNKSEYTALDNSEYRHCLSLWNCSNVTVKGLTFRDSGGDGIYIGGENTNGQGFCQNILVEDVRCLNNYRQGMSVASVENLLVRYSEFSQTQGALPEAGVDIEPYETYQIVKNTRFEKCTFKENGWAGIAVALFEMDGTSDPVDIRFTDCYLSDNRLPSNTYASAEIVLSADDVSPVQGSVIFERCYINGSDWTALYSRKTAEAYEAIFKDCVFQNVSREQMEYNEPIFLEVPDYDNPSAALGGYFFDNVLVSYETDFSFFRVFGAPTLEGLSDISGNFTVIEPNNNDVLYTDVSLVTNVNYTFSNQTSLPKPTVSFDNIGTETSIFECDSSAWILQKSINIDDLTYPLPLHYDFVQSVNLTLGNDLHLLTEGRIIPLGETAISDTLIARNDNIEEGLEEFSIGLQTNDLYDFSFAAEDFTVTIGDCEALGTTPISEVDSDGQLLIDGSPFLPIGFYCEGIDFSEFPDVPEKIKAAGFNMIYNEAPAFELADQDQFLDECNDLGLKNILGLPYAFVDPEDFDFYVNAFSDKPSVVAWNIMDDANNFSATEIELQKTNLLELDNTRVSSASWYNDTDPFTEMLSSVEMAGMQAYPWEDASFNDFVFVESLWRSTVEATNENNVFAFSTPQAFNWGVETYPPPAHVDCQAYIGLITGLKGIMFYTFRDYDLNSTIDITQPEVFAAASRVAQEMLQTEWKEVILFGEHDYVNIDFYRYYATWRYNDYVYLIAVNANDELSYSYDIPLPNDVIGAAFNFFDYRLDDLSIIDNSLQGTLSPYQVAIYRFETMSTNTSESTADVCEVYPNPANDFITIKSASTSNQIEIFDLTGRKVLTENYQASETEIDLRNLTKGVYLLRFTDFQRQEVTSRKLILK